MALALGVLLAAPLPAPAWVSADGAIEGALVPGWVTEDGSVMAGVRLSLAPGWKTYWRAPGEAGIAPRFDWAGSSNLAAVRIHWPRPEVLETGGTVTIGYAGSVVLPVELIPQDPSAPLAVAVDLDLGVCDEVCLPASLSLAAADLREGARAERALIRSSLAARPLTAAETGIGRPACRIRPIRDGLRVEAEIDLPPQGGREAAVIEVPRGDVWVSDAVTSRSGGTLTAAADLVPPEAAPFALARDTLRITVIGEAGAVDIRGCAPA